MRKWIIIIAICGLMGGSFGWFWHHEWVKPCKKVSECSSDEIKRVGLDFKPVRVYQGKWSKDFLEVMK